MSPRHWIRRWLSATRNRRRLALLVVAGAIIVGTYAARESLLTAAARLLTLENAIGPSDYLVVMGGSLEDRPFTAADLFRRGLAPRVVVFEYQPGIAGLLSQTELIEEILVLEGVPRHAIERAAGLVRSSMDEAQSLRRFLAGKQVARVIIVTSPEHTRRTNWTFRKALAGLPIDVRIAASRHGSFDETNWWHRDEGVLLYLHEFLKFPFYVARHAVGRL